MVLLRDGGGRGGAARVELTGATIDHMTRAPLATERARILSTHRVRGATETEDGIPLPGRTGVRLPARRGVHHAVARRRDRPRQHREPDPEVYSICYVNGCSDATGRLAAWLENHPHLVLRDGRGPPDRRPELARRVPARHDDPRNRAELADLIGEVIAGCAATASTPSSSTISTPSRDRITASRSTTTSPLLRSTPAFAHESRLAAGQKNAAEHSQRMRDEVGFDFVVSEECARVRRVPPLHAGLRRARVRHRV